MAGKIVGVAVVWETEASAGSRQLTIDLAAMHRYCRAERVDELLDDLALLCDDVQQAQDVHVISSHHSVASLRVTR
jgi:hypothetical protein